MIPLFAPTYTPGDHVRVTGLHGVFRVLSIDQRGDVTCWGPVGADRREYRAFRPDRLTPAPAPTHKHPKDPR